MEKEQSRPNKCSRKVAATADVGREQAALDSAAMMLIVQEGNAKDIKRMASEVLERNNWYVVDSCASAQVQCEHLKSYFSNKCKVYLEGSQKKNVSTKAARFVFCSKWISRFRFCNGY